MTEPVDPTGWTFTNSPATNDYDEIRVLIGDTDGTSPLITDGELDYLTQRVQVIYGTVDRTIDPPDTSPNLMVAAYAADLIARKFASLPRVSADGSDVDLTVLLANYKAMAAELRAEFAQQQATDGEPIDSSVLIDQLDDDYGIRPLTFGMGQFDNPEAARQDYGDWGDVITAQRALGYGL